MELLNFLKIFLRKLNIIIAIAIITTACGYYVSNNTQTMYQTSEYITVAHEKRSEEKTFSYENYYGEYSSNHFTSTILGWFKNESFTKLITEKFPNSEVIATKVERSNISIKTRTPNQEQQKELAAGTIHLLLQQIERYNDTANTTYSIIPGGQSVSENAPNKKIIVTLALIMGLALGSIIAYIIEELKGVIQYDTEIESITGKQITFNSKLSEQDKDFLHKIDEHAQTITNIENPSSLFGKSIHLIVKRGVTTKQKLKQIKQSTNIKSISVE